MAGFSLIELMVGIAVLGVLLSLALPAFSDWIRNNQVRVAAESLREGLQLARSEAVKRNTRVRMQLVSTLTNSCVLSSTGPYWIVSAGSGVSPAGACGALVGSASTPPILQASPVTAASARVALSMYPSASPSTPATTVAFEASGRLTTTANPTTSIPVATTVSVQMPGFTCVAAGGPVRCLNVIVFPAGEVRMCDPSQTSLTDPTRC